MLNPRIIHLRYVLTAGLVLALPNLGCSGDDDTTSGAGAAGAGTGAAGVGTGGGPAIGPGHYWTTSITCEGDDNDCYTAEAKLRGKGKLSACLKLNSCDLTTETCVQTLAMGASCAPNEVQPCNSTQVPENGVTFCQEDCSFDAACLHCGNAREPCCPSDMGPTCTSGTCDPTGFPSGTCP